jgi:hypothetical protein
MTYQTYHLPCCAAPSGFDKDPRGLPVDFAGSPIAMSPSGVPVDGKGNPVAADALGNPVPLSASGQPLDGEGKPIPGAKVNPAGIVVGKDGKPLVFDAAGNPIEGAAATPAGAVGVDKEPLPRTFAGDPLALAKNGTVLDGNGNPVPGATVGPGGNVTDANGNTLMLDAAGNPIYISPKGEPLDGDLAVIAGARVDRGQVVDHLNDTFALDSNGMPVPVLNEDNLTPLDAIGKPIEGATFDPETKQATSAAGLPLARDFSGDVVAVDEGGNPVDSAGSPIEGGALGPGEAPGPADGPAEAPGPAGAFSSSRNLPVEIDGAGRAVPVDAQGTPLPIAGTSAAPNATLDPRGFLIDPSTRQPAAIDAFGNTLPMNQPGGSLHNPRGLPINGSTVNREGIPVDGAGLPLPISAAGLPLALAPNGDAVNPDTGAPIPSARALLSGEVQGPDNNTIPGVQYDSGTGAVSGPDGNQIPGAYIADPNVGKFTNSKGAPIAGANIKDGQLVDYTDTPVQSRALGLDKGVPGVTPTSPSPVPGAPPNAQGQEAATTSRDDGGGKLAGGAVAGIIIAALVAMGACCLCALFAMRGRRKRNLDRSSEGVCCFSCLCWTRAFPSAPLALFPLPFCCPLSLPSVATAAVLSPLNPVPVNLPCQLCAFLAELSAHGIFLRQLHPKV